MERASFVRLCRASGTKPEDREKFLLELVHQQARQLIENGASNPGSQILSMTNYWDVLHLATESDKNQIALEITSVADELPINYPYLEILAKSLGLVPPKPDSKQLLQEFLLAIPQVNLFDLEFNAFVTRDSSIEGVPFICVYEQLLSTAPGLADVVLPALVSFRQDGSADPAPSSTIAHHAHNPDFMEACKSCFQMLFCQSDQAFVSAQVQSWSKSSREDAARHGFVTLGAADIVWYHEYAHLLLGHLELPPAPRLEFEADNFAFLVLLLQQDRGTAQQWMCLGVVLLFFMLVVLDCWRGNAPSTSHPPAIDRLRKFLRISDVYSSFAARLAALCNPTLEQSWGFRVDENI